MQWLNQFQDKEQNDKYRSNYESVYESYVSHLKVLVLFVQKIVVHLRRINVGKSVFLPTLKPKITFMLNIKLHYNK